MTERTIRALDGTPQILLQGHQDEVQDRLLQLFRRGWRIVPGSGVVKDRLRVVRVSQEAASPKERDKAQRP